MTAAPSEVDLVFEGGGVKGIGLVGALATLEEQGYVPYRVAGTSAGAIVAALLAAEYEAAELRALVLSLDYEQFQDRAWEDKVPLIERSLSLLLDLGLYEGERLHAFMRELLATKGVRTFGAGSRAAIGTDGFGSTSSMPNVGHSGASPSSQSKSHTG